MKGKLWSAYDCVNILLTYRDLVTKDAFNVPSFQSCVHLDIDSQKDV